jgi:hypothetical protein
MAEDRDAQYRRILAHQLTMNQHTWSAVQAHGATPATPLRLDFSYRVPDERSADGLRALLADQTDYDVEVQIEGGLLRKRWSVVGSTQPTAVSPEVLDQWVDWMVTAGLEHGCEFDGWGAEV